MVVGFKKQFVQPILDGTKIHTMRIDENGRWHANMVMHMATGVRTKQYNCFKIDTCKHVEHVETEPDTKTIKIIGNGKEVVITSNEEIEKFARNDGFKSVDEFWAWFDYPFWGRLISWTDFKY